MAFQPGQSGNPNGRPPNEAALSHKLRQASQEKVIYKGEEMTMLDVITIQVIDTISMGKWLPYLSKRYKAVNEKTKFSHLKFFAERVEGLPKQLMDITSGDEPLQPGMGTIIILPSNGREIEDSSPVGAADNISGE